MFMYDDVYSQAAITRIENQRQKIRRNASNHPWNI